MSSALKRRGVAAETVHRVELDPSFPIKILPARYLSKLYQELGQSVIMSAISLSISVAVHIQSLCPNYRSECEDGVEW